MKDVTKMSTSELEALLTEKKQAEKAERDEERKQYEEERDRMVTVSVNSALNIFNVLSNFKSDVMTGLKEWLSVMREYGDAKIQQQNIQLISADGKFKIVYSLNKSKGFDERSKIAEEKMRIFIDNFIKKKDKRQYNLFMSFLEKNSVTNEFDVNSINKFYKFENDFPEYPEYKEACDMFKESYVEQSSKNYARFFYKDENGAWKAVVLDFAAL